MEVNGRGFHFTLGATPSLTATSTVGLAYGEVRGTIVFQGLTESIVNAHAGIRIIDRSREDLPDEIISEMELPNLSVDAADPQPYRFVLHHQKMRIGGRYFVEVLVDIDDSGNPTPGDWQNVASYELNSLLRDEITVQRLGIRLLEVQ